MGLHFGAVIVKVNGAEIDAVIEGTSGFPVVLINGHNRTKSDFK